MVTSGSAGASATNDEGQPSRIGAGAALLGLPVDYRPQLFFSAAALSVRSHVNASPLRPKWPWRAVSK